MMRLGWEVRQIDSSFARVGNADNVGMVGKVTLEKVRDVRVIVDDQDGSLPQRDMQSHPEWQCI